MSGIYVPWCIFSSEYLLRKWDYPIFQMQRISLESAAYHLPKSRFSAQAIFNRSHKDLHVI